MSIRYLGYRSRIITWKSIITFTLLSYGWVAIAWYFSHKISEGVLWVAMVGSILLGAPIFLMGIYGATIRNIHRSAALQPDGWVIKWYERRLLSTILWLAVALLAGFSSLFWLRTLQIYEWRLILVSVPVFLVIFWLANRLVGDQYKSYITVHKSLIFTQCIYAMIMSVAVVGMYFETTQNNPPFYFSEVIRAEQLKELHYTKSLVIQYADRISTYYDGARTFALSNLLKYDSTLPMLIAAVGSLAMFFSIALAFSGFLIPTSEYRRVVSPIDDVDEAGAVDMAKSIFISALVVILVGFIYVPSIAQLDYELKQNPDVGKVLTGVEDAAIPHFEMIENKLYEPGTIDSLRTVQVEFLKKYGKNRLELIGLGKDGFLNMLKNVEPYLDWYYSLPAEYLRLGALLTNSLEDRIAKDLLSHLGKNDPFKSLSQKMDQILASNEKLSREYEKTVGVLLEDHQVIPEANKIQIDRYIPLEAVMAPTNTVVGIDFRTRFGAAGVGAITGIVTFKVVSKTMAKGTVKLAATAMTKAAATKATSGATGAAIGAVIGSIIPGAGTLVGTAVGATLGLVFGVTVDALLLKIDEYLTRDEFRDQIIEAILESKDEYFEAVSPRFTR